MSDLDFGFTTHLGGVELEVKTEQRQHPKLGRDPLAQVGLVAEGEATGKLHEGAQLCGQSTSKRVLGQGKLLTAVVVDVAEQAKFGWYA